MAEHDHITKTDTLGCPACDKLAGRDRVPAPMPEQPKMPDLSAFPSVQHRIEGGKFICPGDESAWCHQYPEDDCDHEYWPCGHEFTSHAECWIRPWIDATDLADSYAGVEHELLLRDEDFPDGDVDWTWEGEYVTFDYARPVGTLGPDCRDGKHDACDGRALDEATDEIVDCACPHHSAESGAS
ncbi:MAG TPA: hypothetical protein VN041_14090 [Microbacterium sp.]|nr:hypothetical protein [Microbacterium sp.]